MADHLKYHLQHSKYCTKYTYLNTNQTKHIFLFVCEFCFANKGCTFFAINAKLFSHFTKKKKEKKKIVILINKNNCEQFSTPPLGCPTVHGCLFVCVYVCFGFFVFFCFVFLSHTKQNKTHKKKKEAIVNY